MPDNMSNNNNTNGKLIIIMNNININDNDATLMSFGMEENPPKSHPILHISLAV